MSQPEQIIYDYIQNDSTVFFLKSDLSGTISFCSNFTQELLGFDPLGKNINDIFLNFTGDLDIIKLSKDSSEKLLNVNTFTGLPQSMYFQFILCQKQILILGKHDLFLSENLRRQIISLNNDLNSLNRQLHKQKSELQKLNSLKDQFLGMAAHDLRKPLSIIMSFTEFLQEDLQGMLEEEQADFLARIMNSTLFMRQIINDFLDVALIEAGHFKLQLSSIDIIRLIKENIRQHQILARPDNIKIALETELPGLMVQCDKSKIEQVMNNLIGNAIEHSPSNTIISIQILDSPDQITIKVTDQGPGIEPEKQKEIFDIFGKDKKKLRGKKSIGLGLAISRKIIQSHSGKLNVLSEVGNGATFYFTIPKKGE